MPEKTCTLCGGDLQCGTMLAPAFSAVGLVVSPNEAKWYSGPSTTKGFGYRLPKPEHTISAYRCSTCGHLELFAY